MGSVIVDTSLPHPMYYLDDDGDTVADFHLAFGPWWYEPAGGATRPEDGAVVTVVGALATSAMPATLVVFEINGLVWRASVEYGMHGWNGGSFWTEHGDTLTVTGTVLADTTYFYHHYYLDSDEDALPNYLLGFGPAWYEPAGGAGRPNEGDTATVWGIVSDRGGVTHLSVYEINGVTWRTFGEPAPWAGDWIPRDHADSTFAYCVNDSTSRIGFQPGHMGHGMGGSHWPDSTFLQFWQIHPDSLPGAGHAEHFMGFYVNVHDPAGQSMMSGQFGGHRGMMRFEQDHQFEFHYYDDILQAGGLSEESLGVHYWDEDMQHWMDVAGATVDTHTNTVTFAGVDLATHYALAAPIIATGVSDLEDVPAGFTLHQNYPNPFNPATRITYDLPVQQHARLVVYDLMGREIARLVDAVQPAGRHDVTFDGRGLPSGVYLYRLEGVGRSTTRRLVLLR